MNPIGVGILTVLAFSMFIMLIVAPVLRLILGAPPEDVWNDQHGYFKHDGEPFHRLRGWGDYILDAYMTMAVMTVMTSVVIVVLWVIGEIVLALT